MKKILLALFLITFCLNGFGVNVVIVDAGTFPLFTFSPATITITQNDIVTFTLATAHDAVEVSKTTWDVNGIAPIIGFKVPFGGGSLLGSTLAIGTHYYVCEVHGPSGMKGTIIVQSAAGIEDTKTQSDIKIYPSLTKDIVSIEFDNSTLNAVEIKLFNLQGKMVNVLLARTEVSGLFLRTFSLKGLASPGVYFIQILSGGKDNTFKKVVIL